jgi:hypothetical protein
MDGYDIRFCENIKRFSNERLAAVIAALIIELRTFDSGSFDQGGDTFFFRVEHDIVTIRLEAEEHTVH